LKDDAATLRACGFDDGVPEQADDVVCGGRWDVAHAAYVLINSLKQHCSRSNSIVTAAEGAATTAAAAANNSGWMCRRSFSYAFFTGFTARH
jgi:hypothetical protein